jgi:hypothetical protein
LDGYRTRFVPARKTTAVILMKDTVDMERLGNSKIWSFLDGSAGIEAVSNSAIRQGNGRYVVNYLELAAKIAELQFRNPSHVLFFRGQSADHKSVKGYSSLKSSIFRPPMGNTTITRKLIAHRYECLAIAEKMLAARFKALKRLGTMRVQRQRLLRWSILQHYEVCDTPLLDVSQSLRIGASFASLNDTDEAFLYALAVPNISGTITASVEAGIQVVRLAGACPPAALRPHVQEGFLLGEYPDVASADQIANYKPFQFDFGLRIIGKFRFSPKRFWRDDNFPKITPAALYPQSKDWLENTTAEIHQHLKGIKAPP